jgi:hypothetical protein
MLTYRNSEACERIQRQVMCGQYECELSACLDIKEAENLVYDLIDAATPVSHNRAAQPLRLG